MISKFTISTLFLLLVCPIAFSQTPESDEKMTKMQQEVELLKKQLDLEKAKSELTKQRIDDLRTAIPASSVKPLEGRTTYNNEREANFESISLSYEALKEVSVKISGDLKNDVSQYSGLVLYHEPDFVALGKYRLYRNQARIALQNYQSLIDLLKKLTFTGELPDSNPEGKFRIKRTDPLMTALSIPSIGTSYATSIAELFSVFRTETNITQSNANIDAASFGVVMASEIRKDNPNLKIYFPQAFVAEYNLEDEGEDSLFRQITQINAANFILDEISVQISKLTPEQQNLPEVKDVKPLIDLVKRQLHGLGIEDKPAVTEDGAPAPRTSLSEFRQMVRAEKLDRFLESGTVSTYGQVRTKQVGGGKIGILKLRVLSSGGSRRETRNLFLGSKTDFSGSITVEIILFDVDGSLQKSNVYSLHTGFRRMKRNENPK
jgi:hypothetical protein